ncbi:unnamed protein product [Cladocopium goreaui]|uniref:Secreted protein n=1 Tax=Cladocopium goreaui TaxID=2562237 RepID=A0A9P1FDJ6_9DINO|nr:unnamed protein product [Cladocopium goreaui]
MVYRSLIVGCFLIAPLVTNSTSQAEDIDLTRLNERRESAEAQRIRSAEALLKENRKEIERLQKRLDETRKWTQAQFNLAERDEINKPELVSQLMQRWQNHREQEIHRLLQFPDKSAGGIESGKALNTLLKHVGAAAYQNDIARRANPDHATPLYEATASTLVDGDLLKHLSYQSKTLGAKAVGRFNDAPMDINWPAELKHERFEKHRSMIETGRDSLLNQLGSNQGITPELEAQLREAVAVLNRDFQQYRKEWIQSPPSSGESRSHKYRDLCNAERHINKLVCTVYQVVEASGMKDVMPSEEFKPGNIEAFLAYMQRHNIEFAAPSNAIDRKAYYQVFNMMVRYYLDLAAAAKAEELLEEEIDYLKETDKELTDVVLGKTLSAETQDHCEKDETHEGGTTSNDVPWCPSP